MENKTYDMTFFNFMEEKFYSIIILISLMVILTIFNYLDDINENILINNKGIQEWININKNIIKDCEQFNYNK